MVKIFRMLNNNRGTWGAVAAATIQAGASIYSANKASKASSNLEGYSIPSFTEDEYYKLTQDDLYNLSQKIIEGDLTGTAFEGIGEMQSDEFLKALDLSNAKISESAMESAAATGRRGGAVTSKVAEAVGENTTNMSYADYLTALEGKQSLLNTYTNTLSTVQSGALNNQSQINNYNLGKSSTMLNYLTALDSADAALGSAEGDAYSQLITTLFGSNSGSGNGSISDIIKIFSSN